MRWLFIFVLMTNVAYVAWQINAPKKSEVIVAPTIKNIKSIVLLSERGAISADENITLEKEVRVSERVSGQVDAVSWIAEETTPDTVLEVEPVDIELTEPVVPEYACFTVGPFHELKKLRAFVKEIKIYVTNAEFRNREEKKLTVYWVYINPEKSRRDARRLGKQLKANKIKDFYIIRTGAKNNGISLGHFSSKYRASKLAKKVKKLGFDVEFEPVFKSYTVYWLDYQIASDKNIPPAIFDKYIKSVDKDKISLLARECVVN